MARTQRVFREFFELPYEERNKIGEESEENALPDESYGDRFGGKGRRSANWGDLLLLYTFPVSDRRHEFWPTHLLLFRDTVEDYCEGTDKLLGLISELISEGLTGVASELLPFLSTAGRDHEEAFRQQPDHSFVARRSCRVEVKDEEWVTVKPVEGWFVVNVGDQIEILSMGSYRSVELRAFVKSKPRISIATFSAPSDESVVGPIPELLTAKVRPSFKPLNPPSLRNRFTMPAGRKLPLAMSISISCESIRIDIVCGSVQF